MEAQYAHNGSVPWNTTVCSSADPQCRRCYIDAWHLHLNESLKFPPSTCHGTNDCVCSLRCHAADDVYAVNDCWTIETTDKFAGLEGNLLQASFIALGTLSIMITVVRCLSRRFPAKTNPTVASNFIFQPVPNFVLDLFGWQRVRRQIIYREMELMAGIEDPTPLVMPPVDLIHTSPSAPDQALLNIEDGLESPKAPAMVNPHDGATAPQIGEASQFAEDLASTASHRQSFEDLQRFKPLTPTAPELTEEDELWAMLSWADGSSSLSKTAPGGLSTVEFQSFDR
ncbi:hypothetical protein PINS_up022422 [Pythium insidiosum]|nr:hypothetical protein PINS_up022422 [Pythium insidiosum]